MAENKEENMDIRTVALEDLQLWEDNPRSIDEKGKERLREQIEDLEPYKPLIVNQDMVVLGGNQRLKVMREMGRETVTVSVVQAETKKEMLEYALSDNDRMGEYDEEKLGELALDVEDLDLKQYKIDVGYNTNIETITERYKMLYRDNEEDEPYAPDDIEDRDKDEGSFEQDREKFQKAKIKQIVLYYKAEDYDGIIDRFDSIAEEHDLENNTEVVTHLLEYYEQNN